MSEVEELFPFDYYNEKSDQFENNAINEKINSNFGNVRDRDAKYVELILQGMGMEKHLDKFLGARICLETFLHLNQSDLFNLGISDAEDIKIILENLENHSETRNDNRVPLNLREDLIIAKNISNQLARLEAYATYLVFRLTKEKFIDYQGDKVNSPARCLKHFAESAISQCNIMAESIYGDSNSDNLIRKLLKSHSLEMPKNLEKKMMVEQKRKSHSLHIGAVMSGIVAVVITAYFIKKRLW